ncbi:MAG TPA: cyclodeaminase/cyclohydrolase family protein [Thermomicrobiales bacterium]|nr:cyclodeaminase/cyclohydrolase family protein [Thermomicrobiales bacterium]
MDHDEKMESRPIGDYLDALASDAPAPGGGSVAGLVGALAAGLGQMVVSLTRDAPDELVQANERLAALRASMIASGAADELAYAGYVDASRMPKSTPEEKDLRRATMQEALKEAVAVPMQLAETASELLETLDPVIRLGSKHVISDAEIGITLALACVDASLVNVRVNIPMIRDKEMAGNLAGHAHKIEQRAHQLAENLRATLAER